MYEYEYLRSLRSRWPRLRPSPTDHADSFSNPTVRLRVHVVSHVFRVKRRVRKAGAEWHVAPCESYSSYGTRLESNFADQVVRFSSTFVLGASCDDVPGHDRLPLHLRTRRIRPQPMECMYARQIRFHSLWKSAPNCKNKKLFIRNAFVSLVSRY